MPRWVVGNAGEDIGEIMLRVDAVELGAFDQRVHRRGSAAAGVGAGEEVILAAGGNHPFILPMSGRSWKFTTGITPISARRFWCAA